MFDLCVKVQEEMLHASSLLSSLPPSELSTVFGCCRASALPAPSLPRLPFPTSESSLQEIKGFKKRSRVSYGALWLSGIAGSD